MQEQRQKTLHSCAEHVLQKYPHLSKDKDSDNSNVVHAMATGALYSTTNLKYVALASKISKYVNLSELANEPSSTQGTLGHIIANAHAGCIETITKIVSLFHADLHIPWGKSLPIMNVSDKGLFLYFLRSKPQMYQASQCFFNKGILEYLRNDEIWKTYAAEYNTTIKDLLSIQHPVHKDKRYCDVFFARFFNQDFTWKSSMLLQAVQQVCGKSIATAWAKQSKFNELIKNGCCITDMMLKEDEHFLEVLLTNHSQLDGQIELYSECHTTTFASNS